MSKKELRIFYKSTHDSLIDQKIKNDSLIKRTNILKNEIKYNSNSHNKTVDSLKTIQFVNDKKRDSLINLLNDKNDDLVNSENYQKLLLDSLNNLLVRFRFEVDSLENINFVLMNDQIRLRDSVDFLSVNYNDKYKSSGKFSHWRLDKVNYSTNEDDFVITDEVKGISINNSDLSITICDNKQSGKLELFTTLSRRKNIISARSTQQSAKIEIRFEILSNNLLVKSYINSKKCWEIQYRKVTKSPCF